MDSSSPILKAPPLIASLFLALDLRCWHRCNLPFQNHPLILLNLIPLLNFWFIPVFKQAPVHSIIAMLNLLALKQFSLKQYMFWQHIFSENRKHFGYNLNWNTSVCCFNTSASFVLRSFSNASVSLWAFCYHPKIGFLRLSNLLLCNIFKTTMTSNVFQRRLHL